MYDTTKPHIEGILKLTKRTSETPYALVRNNLVKLKAPYKDYWKCHHVDGTGHKGLYHWKQKSFKNAVVDGMAMNLNDMLMERATPYAVINHLIVQDETDTNAILEIIDYLVEECEKRDILVTAGETAGHPYNVKGMELSITMLGFVEKEKPNQFKEGDILIGIESNGLHSNGFTRIIEVFEDEYRLEFIEPTYIYSDILFKLDEKYDIHGMMHITGGAFTKLKSKLNDLDAIIYRDHDLEPQQIFHDLYERGVSDEEMYKTFNSGIGFILGVSKEEAIKITNEIKDFKTNIIGEVVSGNGSVKIESKFSNKEIIY